MVLRLVEAGMTTMAEASTTLSLDDAQMMCMWLDARGLAEWKRHRKLAASRPARPGESGEAN